MVRLARARALAVAITVAAAACGDTVPPVSELVLAIQTDVALPDSVDTVRVELWHFGARVFGQDYSVGAGKLLIPATLGLLGGAKRTDPVLIRVIAKKNGVVKMLREVTTPVPTERIVALRIPIRWLCDDSGVEGAPGDYANRSCSAGQTCIGGDCYGTDRDTSQDDGVTTNNVCFDVARCLDGGSPVTVDGTCTIPAPADLSRLNVGLVVENDGICAAGKCFVILDRALDTPNPPEGWRAANGRIQLPRAACNRLASGRVKQILTSSTCAAKTDRDPTCGPWSSVGGPPPVTAPPVTQGELATQTGASIVSPIQCPMTIAAGSLFLCTVTPAGIASVVATKLPGGGPLTTVVPTLGRSSEYAGPWVASDRLYVAQVNPTPTTLYETVGDAAPKAIGPLALPANTYWVGDFHAAIDAQRIYFAAGSGTYAIYAAPRTAGSFTRLTAGLQPGRPSFRGIVADADPVNGFVYAATWGTAGLVKAQIERVSKAGVDNPTTVVATLPTANIKRLLLDGSDLFFIALEQTVFGPASIYRVPAAGGTPTEVYGGLESAEQLVIDGENLYWIAKDAASSEIGVFRAPKAGGATPTLLAHDPGMSAIAVGDAVYYGSTGTTNPPNVRVVRVAK